MKFKFLLLPILFFSNGVYSFAGDIGKGEVGSTGGLGISERMLFSTRPTIITIDVYILDANTREEIDILSVDELEDAIDRLTAGEYLLIYSYMNGSIIEQTLIQKE